MVLNLPLSNAFWQTYVDEAKRQSEISSHFRCTWYESLRRVKIQFWRFICEWIDLVLGDFDPTHTDITQDDYYRKQGHQATTGGSVPPVSLVGEADRSGKQI